MKMDSGVFYLFCNEVLWDENIDETRSGHIQLFDDVIVGRNFRDNFGGNFTRIRFDAFGLKKKFLLIYKNSCYKTIYCQKNSMYP